MRKLVGGTRKPNVGANEREADGVQEGPEEAATIFYNNPKGLKTRKEIRRIIVVSFFFFRSAGYGANFAAFVKYFYTL